MAHEGTCPNCGHCDKCGRSNFRPWSPTFYPYWSVQPPYYTGDVFPKQYTVSSGTNTQVNSTGFYS